MLLRRWQLCCPYSMKMLEIDAVGMLDTTAEELGKVFVTTELGGAGTASAKSIDIARKGTINLLRHAGILTGAAVPAPSRWLDMPSSDCFTFAEDDGLVVFVRDLGDTVTAGETIAVVYPVGKPVLRRSNTAPLSVACSQRATFPASSRPATAFPSSPRSRRIPSPKNEVRSENGPRNPTRGVRT